MWILGRLRNTGKLVAAKTLIRAVYRLLDGRKVRVLVDSWYMRRIFIESMLARGFDVIGQVRIDTRLYDEPPKRKKCRVPCDYIPKRSYPLFRTRQILNDWLTQNLEEA